MNILLHLQETKFLQKNSIIILEKERQKSLQEMNRKVLLKQIFIVLGKGSL